MTNKLITSAMLEETRIQHYGVLGMKWGVRKKPEANQDISINSLEGYLLGIGISLLLTGAKHVASNVGNKRVMKMAEEPDKKITKLKEAAKIAPPETYLQSVKNTNNTKSINKNFKNNCPNTTMAYELRRRGYDVKAKPSPTGMALSGIRKSYNIKNSDISIDGMNNLLNDKKNSQKLLSYFESVPNNYRGAITVTWAGVASAGHIFNVEKVNGKTIFIDAQTGKHGEFKGLNFIKSTIGKNNNPGSYLSRASYVEIFRTDNAVIDETNLSDRLLRG